jgi:hypothetical protein
VWDSDTDPVAADPFLTAVVSVNQVTHLPVPVAPRADARKERAFVAPVFLNAADTTVRVELRSGNRLSPLAQQGYGPAGFRAECAHPILKQRLHLVVICPDVARSERFELVRHVVEGLGGSIPDGQPGFDRGEFRQPAFDRALVYRPLVHDVDLSGIVALSKEVEREIRRTTSRPGQEWLNDVIVVYYQGRREGAEHGRRLLHTTRSLAYKDVDATMFMAPVGDLAPDVGARFAVLNVIDPLAGSRAALAPGEGVVPDVAVFRIPNKDAEGVEAFPAAAKQVVPRITTLGEWSNEIPEHLTRFLAAAAKVTLAESERDRVIHRE